MASKTSITSEKILEIVKNKWQVFGISAFLIYILQLLSSKVLISVFLGLIITALLPSESLTKVLKKLSTKKEENYPKWQYDQRLEHGVQSKFLLFRKNLVREMENTRNIRQPLVTRLVKSTEDKENNQGVSKEALFLCKITYK